jgi:hypothetical protein
MKRIIGFLALFSLFSGAAFALEQGQIDIHGFISQGYLRTDHNNYLAQTEEGSFEFNELGLNFGTDLTDKLRIGMQFFARDLGKYGNDDLVLDWAFADYRWRDWLGFRVGRIKFPFGYYNAIRDFDMLRTSLFASQSVYSELLRDTYSFIKGASLYGYQPLGGLGNLSYSYITGIGNVAEETGLVGAQENFFAIYNLKINEASISQAHAMDLQWETPLSGMMLGCSLYYFKDMYFEGTLGGNGGFADLLNLTYAREYQNFKGYFLTLRYAVGDFVFLSECTSTRIETQLSPNKREERPTYLKSNDIISQGWYVSLAYRLNPFLEIEYAYSEFYPDRENKDGKATYPDTPLYRATGVYGGLLGNEVPKLFYGIDFEAWKKTSTVSFRFDINENWLIKLETAYNDGFGDYTSADNGDTIATRNLKRYWWLYAAKVTYNF